MNFRKVLLIVTLIILIVPVGNGVANSDSLDSTQVESPEAAYKAYIPVTTKYVGHKPIYLGVYPDGYVGFQSVVDDHVHALNAWADPGAQVTFVGTFIGFEENGLWYNVPQELETLWTNGFTCIMNIETTHTAYQVATGKIDQEIRTFAKALKSWTDKGEGRFVYLVPFPEMNGDWVVWGLDPWGFKTAFLRIQTIFAQEGVPDKALRWVFAPNGWSDRDYPGFEDYYPGDGFVDIVGFSGYNFGYSPVTTSKVWQNPPEVYNPDYPPPEGYYLERMRVLAPSKPIFIMQTATTAYYIDGIDHEKKDEWLRDAYQFLAKEHGVRAIIYLNINNKVDWPFYIPGDIAHQFQGYRDGINNMVFRYISPQRLSDQFLTP